MDFLGTSPRKGSKGKPERISPYTDWCFYEGSIPSQYVGDYIPRMIIMARMQSKARRACKRASSAQYHAGQRDADTSRKAHGAQDTVFRRKDFQQ